ncbi:MAG: hypothetical protein HY273_10595 [Gammaproteobacteria bacterium]|nr:hypothetical protein [Gammaproteobacteria bacterium]
MKIRIANGCNNQSLLPARGKARMGVVKNIDPHLRQLFLRCSTSCIHAVANLPPSQREGVLVQARYEFRKRSRFSVWQFVTFILLPVFLLTACGFHLRGAVQLPRGMDVTYLQDQQPSSTIAAPLRQLLTSNGARVTSNVDEATATLRIVSEAFDRHMLSIGRTATEKTYELIYTVTFAGQAKNNAWNADAQEIRITREMIFDEAQVLAKTAEQEQLRNVMVQDAARQILVRLQSKAK